MSAYEIGSAPSFCAYSIGDLEIFTLRDGHSDRPVRAGMVANAEVAEIEAALRAAGLPPTSMRSHFTALAVRDRGRLMLIDTGTGGAPVYGPDSGYLLRSMAAAGLERAVMADGLLDLGALVLLGNGVRAGRLHYGIDRTPGRKRDPGGPVTLERAIPDRGNLYQDRALPRGEAARERAGLRDVE